MEGGRAEEHLVEQLHHWRNHRGFWHLAKDLGAPWVHYYFGDYVLAIIRSTWGFRGGQLPCRGGFPRQYLTSRGNVQR